MVEFTPVSYMHRKMPRRQFCRGALFALGGSLFLGCAKAPEKLHATVIPLGPTLPKQSELISPSDEPAIRQLADKLPKQIGVAYWTGIITFTDAPSSSVEFHNFTEDGIQRSIINKVHISTKYASGNKTPLPIMKIALEKEAKGTLYALNHFNSRVLPLLTPENIPTSEMATLVDGLGVLTLSKEKQQMSGLKYPNLSIDPETQKPRFPLADGSNALTDYVEWDGEKPISLEMLYAIVALSLYDKQIAPNGLPTLGPVLLKLIQDGTLK